MYYYLYKWHSILISYLVVKITKLVITHVAFLIFHTNIWVTSCQCKRYLILIAPLFDLINYRAGGIFPFIPQILSKTCSLNLHFITAPPNIFRPSTVSAVFKRHRTLWRKACFSKDFTTCWNMFLQNELEKNWGAIAPPPLATAL